MVSGSTGARLHSSGSDAFEGFNCFVFDQSRLLGGPSTWLGFVVATVVSIVFSTGSSCLPSSCWSVFHPNLGGGLVESDFWLFYPCCRFLPFVLCKFLLLTFRWSCAFLLFLLQLCQRSLFLWLCINVLRLGECCESVP